jgi:hypothetical protein
LTQILICSFRSAEYGQEGDYGEEATQEDENQESSSKTLSEETET